MLDNSYRALRCRQIYNAAHDRIARESSGVFFFDADAVLDENNDCVAWGNDCLNQLGYRSRYGFAAHENVVERLGIGYGSFGAVADYVGAEVDVVAENRGIDDKAFFLDDVVVRSTDSCY